jgi:peptide/nickel transport system substrate-binding protein
LSGDLPGVKILPEKMVNLEGPIPAPTASGPWKFSERKGRDLIFIPHPFRDPKPHYSKLIIRTIEDPTTRFLALIGGDIDILFNALSPSRIEQSLQEPRLRVYRQTGTTFQYLGFNLRLPKFKDVRVRRALALAIDRESIIQHKLRGYAQIATSFLPPRNPFHNPNLPPINYNLSEAKKLLKEAKVENLEVEIKSSSDRDVLSYLLVIQESWEKIGVKVKIRPFEFGTFFSDVQQGNFEMFSLRWTGVTEPDLMNKVFHSREFPPGRNRVFYSNPEVDQLLDQAFVEANELKRKQFYDRIQSMISKDLPYIPLWYPDNVVVGQRIIRNFDIDAAGAWTPISGTSKMVLE